jgi:DNA-directed RNA polymerase sigma subunit (sigma70/sigma32)
LTVVKPTLWPRNLMPAAPIWIVALLTLSASPYKIPVAQLGSSHTQFRAPALSQVITQDDESNDNEISTEDIEKFVSVYKAMQHNRSLTIDQAAAAQGLTTEQFRRLENRVQRDDAALQQARDELQAAAQGAPSASKTPRPTHP